MKKFLLLIVFVLLVSTSFADYTQNGYVKTRGRKNAQGTFIPGTRLGNATVILQSGSSVRSNGSGNFSLKMPTRNFFLKSVKKQGYQVVDPDILSKQYICNPNPLILVLEEPEVQQDDKLASERKLRRNLQQRLQQREDELEKQKAENRITQKQYREALQKLYAEQESNEKFISEMAERYSKLDFDQLDEFQNQIAEFIQNGQLSRADSLLRTRGNIDKREAEYHRMKEANKELRNKLSKSEKMEAATGEELASDFYHYFEISKLRFNNDSAAYWLKRRADLDSDNIPRRLEAGEFIRVYLADYQQALSYFTNMLTHAKSLYGEIHPEVAMIHNKLGNVYAASGDFSSASQHYDKALDIQSKVYGVAGSDSAKTILNIADMYGSAGFFTSPVEDFVNAPKMSPDSAEAMTKRSKSLSGILFGKERPYVKGFKVVRNSLVNFGKNHPDIAATYTNIGNMYLNNLNYMYALLYFMAAKDIQKDIYGEYNPEVAACYNNIGYLYYALNNYASALENYEKALTVQRKIFGDDHPAVATGYINIGGVDLAKDNFSAALQNYERALNIRLKQMGRKHPSVAVCYNNIGRVYAETGDYSAALDNLQKALDIFSFTLSSDHPNIKDIQDKIEEIKEISTRSN